MMNRELKNKIFYVGVNDRQKTLFENMLPLPYGVSYNSYFIDDEKTVLVDTVEQPFAEGLLAEVQDLLHGRQLDYLVVNHMEPDHSSGIKTLRAAYPGLQIVVNCKTVDMLGGYYGIRDGFHVVRDGDTLSIGSRTLQFIFAPMVHWPEVMFTYVVEDHVIFSADAFGCFGTLDGAILDTDLNLDKYRSEMVRYYACIVGKFGPMVQKALCKIRPLQIDMICSTHGPVWTEHIPEVCCLYDRMSRYETVEGVTIAYGSMYGHTEAMAEMVARGAASVTKNVTMYDVSRTDASYILADLFRYKGFICGSPTYCAELYPGIDALLNKIKTRCIKNHAFGCFGSFTWANSTKKPMLAFAEAMGWECDSQVEVKQAMTPEQAEALYELGRQIALKSKE